MIKTGCQAHRASAATSTDGQRLGDSQFIGFRRLRDRGRGGLGRLIVEKPPIHTIAFVMVGAAASACFTMWPPFSIRTIPRRRSWENIRYSGRIQLRRFMPTRRVEIDLIEKRGIWWEKGSHA